MTRGCSSAGEPVGIKTREEAALPCPFPGGAQRPGEPQNWSLTSIPQQDWSFKFAPHTRGQNGSGQRESAPARDRWTVGHAGIETICGPFFDCVVLFPARLASIVTGMLRTEAPFLGYIQKPHSMFPGITPHKPVFRASEPRTVSYINDYNVTLRLRISSERKVIRRYVKSFLK